MLPLELPSRVPHARAEWFPSAVGPFVAVGIVGTGKGRIVMVSILRVVKENKAEGGVAQP